MKDYLTASILKSLKGKTISDVKLLVSDDIISLHKLVLNDGTIIEMNAPTKKASIKRNNMSHNTNTTKLWIA